ncbi:hypothetical protein [Acetobacter fallax]|uniref:HNH endonuclease n=1 Tax=Acetobacter fallax TaxID=1737473 RepID=A0ABX0KAP3_9PROT|nr:hypothetical protein [Acetobacter fallax]NHO33504.1 hypothetical protein [Acetobacter fallax]NHO37153.1 hypothetical protein [Acetobacter fallax]
MPIRPELRKLYPPDWPQISRSVRFERAQGRCQRCGRPHGQQVRAVAAGRWFDADIGHWRDARGRATRCPDLIEQIGVRETRVVLAAAHLDHDPRNNRWRNLRALCQRCHLAHDRVWHARQRRLTWNSRSALGDLFEGPYRPGILGIAAGQARAGTVTDG